MAARRGGPRTLFPTRGRWRSSSSTARLVDQKPVGSGARGRTLFRCAGGIRPGWVATQRRAARRGASMGLSMLLASMAPSAAPAPTTVCSSSMKTMICPSASDDLFQHGFEPVPRTRRGIWPRRSWPPRSSLHQLSVFQPFRHVAATSAAPALDDGRLAHAARRSGPGLFLYGG